MKGWLGLAIGFGAGLICALPLTYALKQLVC